MSVGVARVTNGIKSIEPESAGHTAERPLDGSLKVCPVGTAHLKIYPDILNTQHSMLDGVPTSKLLDCSNCSIAQNCWMVQLPPIPSTLHPLTNGQGNRLV